ncbi:hypothetical protein JAAARDRAFT_129754 [Jaapia argillacea MUCL 33604]|uniref:Transcription initiation factor TFIID subunit 11 n=1 Tax=Jaapia argillacea MUCL 33604 TaxID=933084 RepID=A0A067Q332_9AGAM|nr:hypothetical protein JAAARDRAFT_129754 [Jaapia argillacea MUCL 33604]
MNPPFPSFPSQERTFIPATPGAPSTRGRGTGAKRGRKPRQPGSITSSPRPPSLTPGPSTSQSTPSQWSQNATGATTGVIDLQEGTSSAAQPSSQSQPSQENGLGLPGVVVPAGVEASTPAPTRPSGQGGDEDEGGEDEILPAMADDDYSAQLSWQSQSKDNLKVLMDNFTPQQYERFEAYRRHALPKQAVRKVIQQTLGQQVSQPVAQIVAGFAKVFVGEIVEKARAAQARRGETGPLSPDHLREAYRKYQAETGRVGAARPLRSKRMFVR